MIVYKLTDRIPVSIGDVKFWLSPMSFEQRAKVLARAKMVSGEEVRDGQMVSFLALKFSIKEAYGLMNADGTQYVLEFDSAGDLTDDCASELLQMDHSPNLIRVASEFISGIKDPKINGVSVDLKGVKSVKKKPVTA